MNLRKIIDVLKRIIHPSANAPDGERAAAKAKLSLMQKRLSEAKSDPPPPADGITLNQKGNRRYGVRWCRREIRLWERGDSRARFDHYEEAKKLLGIRTQI